MKTIRAALLSPRAHPPTNKQFSFPCPALPGPARLEDVANDRCYVYTCDEPLRSPNCSLNPCWSKNWCPSAKFSKAHNCTVEIGRERERERERGGEGEKDKREFNVAEASTRTSDGDNGQRRSRSTLIIINGQAMETFTIYSVLCACIFHAALHGRWEAEESYEKNAHQQQCSKQ